VGVFQFAKSYPAYVRFSNASSIRRPDSARDLRGVAIRVIDDADKQSDFLATNAAASHARDARQFMIVAAALVRRGRPAFLWRLSAWRMLAAVVRIAKRCGTRETLRILRTTRMQTSRPVASLATERYWSRAPFAFGAVAVKFRLSPSGSPESPVPLRGASPKSVSGDSRREAAEAGYPLGAGAATRDLRSELKSRLKEGGVQFDFQVQRYVDEVSTPIEDATVEWAEDISPFVTIARLIIPAQELDDAAEREIDRFAFNPWNTGSDDLRPLGSMNRARKLVYSASARLRQGSGIRIASRH
jgi:hypothetical protein